MNREMQSINRQRGFAADLLSTIHISGIWLGCIGLAEVLEYIIWQEEWYGWMPLACSALLCVFCPPRAGGSNGLRITKLAMCLLVMSLLISLPPLQPYAYAFKVFCSVCLMVILIFGAPMRRLAKQLDRS